MVQDICRDIKRLDVAKRHLTMTILTLARLKTLVSAVSQMQGHVARRAYEEAAPLLEASIQLFSHFTDFARVPKIMELAGAVEATRSELKEMITEDFDVLVDCVTPSTVEGGGGGGGGDDGGGANNARALSDDNSATLSAACECVDALGPSVRKALLKSFSRKQLKPYTAIFRSGVGGLGDALEAVDRRYAWFRLAQRALDDCFARVLPSRWRVTHRLALDFCEATRADVERILGQFDPPSSAPAEPLLRALLKTLGFEKEMAKKYEADMRRDAGAASAAAFAEMDRGLLGGGGGGRMRVMSSTIAHRSMPRRVGCWTQIRPTASAQSTRGGRNGRRGK